MHTHKYLTTPRYRSRGFSMVELMVALVITLILLAGIGQIFLGSKKSFVIQNTLGRIQENGRYAMNVLASGLRRAGYWGGNADINSILGTEGINAAVTEACTDTTNGPSDWTRMLDRPIYGLDLSGSETPADTGNDYTCIKNAGATPYVRGDVLLVRYAHPSAIGSMTKPLPCNGSDTTIAACYPNEYFLRSSLFRGRLFKGSESEQVENNLVAPAIRTAELVAHAYYIGNSSTASACPADGNVPSLFRISLNDAGDFASEEVAYGVDNLQVKYGIGLDTDGDDINDSFRYFDADEIDSTDAAKPDWEDVVAARVWLLVRAECPETGYTNNNTYTMSEDYTPADTAGRGYRRKLYTSIINLRNKL